MCTIALGFLCTWGNFIKPEQNRFMQQCIKFVLCNYSNLEFLYYKTVTWKFDIKNKTAEMVRKIHQSDKVNIFWCLSGSFFHLWVDVCGAVFPVTLSAYNIWYGYRSLRNARVIRHFFIRLNGFLQYWCHTHAQDKTIIQM